MPEEDNAIEFRYCGLRPQPEPSMPEGLNLERVRAIVRTRSKWANGTVLHYYFFDRDTDGEQVRLSDGSTRFVSWVGAQEQREVVRRAFATWQELGIGLRFEEVPDRAQSELRIGFMDGDGSWSYVGRDVVLHAGVNDRTMNFGWDLTADDYGMTTALHEIGHTIGMPHEHQNPFAGIEWDEAKVYQSLSGPPNFWDRQTIFHNILRKLATDEVTGSAWDPDSIMHYGFGPGLIRQPAQYAGGIRPPGVLSPVDKEFVRKWYPAPTGEPAALEHLKTVQLELTAGQQADFVITPPATAKYQIGTFGGSDSVLVLFEEVDGQPVYLAGDDDSGTDLNALIEAKLLQGRRYLVRLRLYYSWSFGGVGLMYW
ncbi:M12 family metallopeptidase [Crossiella sp. SN42]|uniref:M12 family metallopeptidase n=1 Tax=Crossiella sp. SN42 TaxID=2944808 RepID=UPI00207CF2E0|nr:M12 family metallopeptidase [Crossiella sp. SN42]MCO1577392.1 M12 family metallopeptidase [Crossiella sp. SN42]